MSNWVLNFEFSKKMSVQDENEVPKSESSETQSSKKSEETAKCDRKCLHYGDRVCYNDEETKNILKKIPEESSQTESMASADSLHSGESLFKTFTFDTQDNDPDLEKCMAFWKTILAKNIKPIKCTLLKSKKAKQPIVREAPQKTDPCDAEETKKMWLDIYKDLQRRQLDKIKLGRKRICDPCAEYIDEDELKKQDKEDIKKLNEWSSQSKPTRFGKTDVKSQIQRTLRVLKGNRQSKQSVDTESVKKSSTSEAPREKSLSQNILKRTSVVTQEKSRSKVSVKENAGNACCNCGCLIQECICEELEDVDVLVQGTKPTMKDNHQICKCGCPVEECICRNVGGMEMCTCGCRVDECICQNVDSKDECGCGCGVDDCICQQLFTRSCKCVHDDCNCDMVGILSTYLESLNASPVSRSLVGDTEEVISTQTQTAEQQWLYEGTRKQGSYCVICGHFNCYCKLDKTS